MIGPKSASLLAIPRSSFYRFDPAAGLDGRGPEAALTVQVLDIFWRHQRRYGARRIVSELADRGIVVCRRTVAKVLRSQGLKAIGPKSFTPRTTQSRHTLGYNDNLLLDGLELRSINQLWVGDITYIPMASGRFCYLAVTLDRFSRRVVGWKFDTSMTEELVIGSLLQAIQSRQPFPGLIYHSDRGGQYAGTVFRQILSRADMRQSMSRAAECYDNAFMESCFGTVKRELLMTEYDSTESGDRELGEYFRYYNHDRKHSSLGYLTPVQFEANQSSRS